MSNPTIFLERYRSSKPIEPQEFLVYQIQRQRTDQAVNLLTLARAIAGRINNGRIAFFACTDDEFIYVKRPLTPFYLAGHIGDAHRQTYCEYELNLSEKKIVPFSNQAIYNQYLRLLIENKALNYQPKPAAFPYTVKNGEIFSRYLRHEKTNDHRWITNLNYKTGKSSGSPSVRLLRHYQINPEIREDGSFAVSLTTKIDFDACKSLYDLVHSHEKKAKDLMGLTVKYSLPTGLRQVGIVVPAEDYLAANPGKDLERDASVAATRSYLQDKYSKNPYIKDFLQKEYQERPDNFIVYVRINATTVYQYLASSVYPVMTTEYVAAMYESFSKVASHYTKLKMGQRINVDQEFLGAIGAFSELGQDIYLVPYPREAGSEGYSYLSVKKPQLRIGHNQLTWPDFNGRRKLFQKDSGYYSIPKSFREKNTLDVNILGDSSRFQEDHLKLFFSYLYKNGIRYGSPCFLANNEQGFSIHLNIRLVDYGNGTQSILDAMHKMNQEIKSDINIIVLDKFNEKLPANFHDELKEQLSWDSIPSQMVDAQTVWNLLWDYERQETVRAKAQQDFHIDSDVKDKLNRQKKNEDSGYTKKKYLDKNLEAKRDNLVLQILAKIGCIPAILDKPLPGNIDLILGLDVGMLERGIHYPGCSVMIDNQGRFLGMYAPNRAQSGEKIPTKLLKNIFDKSLNFYAKAKGSLPSRILIMRDGFSNEEDSFYETYFKERNIQYDIVEVRKNCGLRLATGYVSSHGASFENPPTGVCLVKENEGILVTTEGYYSGAPRPLKIVHTVGELTIQEIMQICYSLTKIYPGSMQNIRLPYPTYVADRVCKSYDRIPHDIITNRNFFM